MGRDGIPGLAVRGSSVRVDSRSRPSLFRPRSSAVPGTAVVDKGRTARWRLRLPRRRTASSSPNGSGAIVRVAHRGRLTAPRLVVEDRVSLGGHLPRGDAVTGLAPTSPAVFGSSPTNGVVGTVTPQPNRRSHVASTRLPRGEQMNNRLSVRPERVGADDPRPLRMPCRRRRCAAHRVAPFYDPGRPANQDSSPGGRAPAHPTSGPGAAAGSPSSTTPTRRRTCWSPAATTADWSAGCERSGAAGRGTEELDPRLG